MHRCIDFDIYPRNRYNTNRYQAHFYPCSLICACVRKPGLITICSRCADLAGGTPSQIFIGRWRRKRRRSRGAVTAPSAGDTSKDYDYEEDQQRAPGNLAKSTADPKVPEPYFEHSDVDIYVAQNATSAKLECPVKNYNGKLINYAFCF